MRRLLVPISFSVALTELVVGGTLPAIAQDATPDAGAAQFSFTPDPADCAGEPRSADDLLALWYAPDGSPVAVEVDPGTDESETEVTIPIGAPADDATVVAVTDTVGGVFACFEAGNALGAYALFTDDMAQRFGPEPGTPREGRSVSHGRLDPDLDPDEVGSGSQILGITDVMTLADGRIGAFVVDESEGTITNAYVVFVQEGDLLLVDEVVEFGAGDDEGDGDGESEGTPTP